MFITDPPILADIGDFHFDSNNLTLKLDGNNYFDDGTLQVKLNAVDFDLEPLSIDMDGINDMSDVVTRLLNFGGNTITSRLSSMSKFAPVLDKLSRLLNAFFKIIPDELFLDDDVYITGGVDDQLHSLAGKNGYLSVPLDLALHSCKYPYDMVNNAKFVDVAPDGSYQIQFYLSEYFIMTFVNVLYYDHGVKLDLGVLPIGTTGLDTIFLGKLLEHDFEDG